MTKTKQAQQDLRQTLVESGLEILRQDGLQGLTLRACAARSGVSHAAPAYHFAGLPGLLAGIAAAGFDQLSEAILNAQAGCEDAPSDQLAALCEGYIEFAKTQPALFTLMFNTDMTLEWNQALKSASDRAYTLLHKACEPFEPPSGVEGTTETTIWALLHGFASLQIGAHFRLPEGPGAPPPVSFLMPKLKLRKLTP